MGLRKIIKNLLYFLIKLSLESSLFSSLGARIFITMILHQRPLRPIYVSLPLTNSTALIANVILWCTKILFPIDYFPFLFHRKNFNPLLLSCPLYPTQTPPHTLNLIYSSLIPWMPL
jgi:hypothetical protein